MLTAEERALVTDIGDTLLDLYARRDEAIRNGDLDRLQRLQAEITDTAAQRMKRRHVREKAVIDHLAEKVFDPSASPGAEPMTHGSTTDDGFPVEEQVRKEWNPRNGGLPTFCRR
jgi:hypothetical protein